MRTDAGLVRGTRNGIYVTRNFLMNAITSQAYRRLGYGKTRVRTDTAYLYGSLPRMCVCSRAINSIHLSRGAGQRYVSSVTLASDYEIFANTLFRTRKMLKFHVWREIVANYQLAISILNLLHAELNRILVYLKHAIAKGVQ